jgi:hypothetical protein
VKLLLLFSGEPPELAGGRYPAPAWVILVLGGLVAAGAAVYLAVRLLRGAKEKR